MKRPSSHSLEFCIAACTVCLIVVVSNAFFTKDAALDCQRTGNASLPNCSLVQTSMVNRKVIHIESLKAAYVNTARSKYRNGEIKVNYVVVLLTEKGELEFSDSYSNLAQQEVDQINQFINSSQPSFFINEEHLKEAQSIFHIFGNIFLVFVFLGYLVCIGVIS